MKIDPILFAVSVSDMSSMYSALIDVAGHGIHQKKYSCIFFAEQSCEVLQKLIRWWNHKHCLQSAPPAMAQQEHIEALPSGICRLEFTTTITTQWCLEINTTVNLLTPSD